MADEVKRYRRRNSAISGEAKRQEIYERVYSFFDQDREDRDVDLDQRLQRYAKYRMWTSGGEGGPWPDSSDVSLSDMTEKSLRLQDTLHNAVVAQRPAVVAEAVLRADAQKEDTVSSLLDYQFFIDAPGETIVGDMAEKFINDGVYTLFIPWVRERKMSSVTLVLPGIPQDAFPADYFAAVLSEMASGPFQGATVRAKTAENPWDFVLERVSDGEGGNGELMKADASFYTRDDRRLDLVIKQEVTVFDGPLPRVIDYDDVFHPVRAANLQPPGPSNPGGASHVIIRDYPTKDEIRRLQQTGFYDLMTKQEVEALDGVARPGRGDREQEQQQKDDLAGKNEEPTIDKAKSHETLTRLVCFDRYDIDGDGLDEDVIWWVLLEPKLVVKAKILEEMYPGLPPNHPRPTAEAALFPVAGRRTGMSMLELLEGLHDLSKTLFDQTVDGNTMAIASPGFYRPTSSMQSEVIRFAPGELYPLSDPSRDVVFPTIGNAQAMGMALNLMTMVGQMGERVSVIGDLQLGRVPAGRSAALRTTSNMNLLAGQSEARPERILRRFFTGYCEAYMVMHSLNQFFLTKGKQIRMVGVQKPGADPYVDITEQSMVSGRFRFKFKANALNTSKAQLQQTLQTLMGTYINALTIQLGVTTPETIYNLLRDYGKALGADPESQRYLNPPTPDLIGPKYMAEDALTMILTGQMPEGGPMEPGGWAEHLQKFQVLMQAMDADEGLRLETPPAIVQMMQQYVMIATQRAQEQMQQQQLLANAQAFGQAQGQPGDQGGRPPQSAQAPSGNPPVSGGGEMLDETLPTAGGGAQQ